jgi:hypothetical protein
MGPGVNAIPTTTISILGTPDGETETDQFGDSVESAEPFATGIPAAIHTGRETVATESDPNAVVVWYFTGRVPAGTAITRDQRIRDEATGTIYLVDNVVDIPNAVMPQDVRLDLRRVT